MRQTVIERAGVRHYALLGTGQKNWSRRWFVFCDSQRGTRREYQDDDIVEDLPTCVQCLGEEMLRGKDLEPVDFTVLGL